MSDPTNHDMILGEMRGQMREVVHGLNNLSGKFDALSREVIGLGPLAADVAALRLKVAALEASEAQRVGAMKFSTWFLRMPLVGWLVGGGVALWAYLKGAFS